MKILYCNKYNFRFSGTESYLFDAMEGMRECGHEVALFSMADPRGAPTLYGKYLPEVKDFKSARGLLAKARLAGSAIYSIAARAKMRAMIDAFRPDVAHVRNIYHHPSPSILWELKARGIPVLYHVNDFKLLCPTYNMVLPNGEPCERCAGGKFINAVTCGCYVGGRAAGAVLAAEGYFHRWLKTYEKCVDLLLAPSDFVREQFIKFGWQPSRIQVLPHFQNLPARTEPHPGLSAPVLYFGRLSPEKGVADLITAMAQLPKIRLVIAGDGPHRSELERQASSLRMTNVIFTGHVEGAELERLIVQSQFTIFPSHAYETFGKSILESYAHARAVVASDLGSRREIVHDHKTGILYQSRNADELAAAMRFLRDRPEVANSLGQAGWRLVRDKYSKVDHFISLEKIYARLSNGSKARVTVERSKPLHIALIGGRGIASQYSGIETCCEQIGRRLVERGHTVTAYCRSYFTPDIEEYDGIRVVRLPTVRTKHLETIVHTFLSTVHACFSRCDIVNYQALGPALFSFVPRLFGKKTVVTVQGLDWKRQKWSRIARVVLLAGEWASAHFPNYTIVVSRTLEEHYLRRHGVRAQYVPNGTSIRWSCCGPHLRRFELNPEQYVVFVGRLSPEKNCHLLIEAFREIPGNKKLVFAGGSSHSDSYVANLKKHPDSRVCFPGLLSGDALEEVLTNAAVLVLPSGIEGLSLSLLDAMGAGLCVLASDIPENREAVGDAGFTFKNGDVEDLRRMLTILLADGNLRAASGQKARERVQQNYLWETVVEQTEKVYLDLIMDTPSKTLSRVVTAGSKAA